VAKAKLNLGRSTASLNSAMPERDNLGARIEISESEKEVLVKAEELGLVEHQKTWRVAWRALRCRKAP
jgi:hypothetical protein